MILLCIFALCNFLTLGSSIHNRHPFVPQKTLQDALRTKSKRSLGIDLKCIKPEQQFLPAQSSLVKSSLNTNAYNFMSDQNADLGKLLIKKVRNKNIAYYEDVVNNLIMYFCDVKTLEDSRCIDENSQLVVKDWKGQCIVTSDEICPLGKCEGSSNCYWMSAEKGQDRLTRFPKGSYTKAQTFLFDASRDSYIGTIAFHSALGVALAAFLFLLWTIFVISRFCCCCFWRSCGVCRFCSPIPRDNGYNICCSKIFPLLFFMISTVGIAVTGYIAYIGNETISEAVSNTFYHSSLVVEDLDSFLDRAKSPLEGIIAIVDDAAIDAQIIFKNTDYVKDTATEIIASFKDFGSLHLDGLSESDSLTGFNNALSGFNDKVYPIVDEIQFMLDTLQNDLYDNVDLIQSSLTSAVSQIESLQNETSTYREEIYALEALELSYRPLRQQAVLSIFVLSLFLALLGIIAMLLGKCTECTVFLHFMDCSGVISSLLGSIVFVLASITLCICIFWYDTCQMSTIVTRDFEPFLGNKLSPGANACFDNTNLAVAFNMTDKVDFEAKLDEGLTIIKDVNITEIFKKVTDPLTEIQSTVEGMTTTAISHINQAISANEEVCPFNDIYTKETILKPWTANKDKTTKWILLDTGTNGDYDRQSNETSTEYMARIYNIAGTCAPQDVFQDCCRQGTCGNSDVVPLTEWCDDGSGCRFPCTDLMNFIVKAHSSYLSAVDKENKIKADLGLVCPVNYVCPTQEFRDLNHPLTLVKLLHKYKENVTKTSDGLVNLASTSVGDVMLEVQEFICNMDISFVGEGYEQVNKDICSSMFGGFTQLNLSLWILALFLQINTAFAFILSVRLRGLNSKVAQRDTAYSRTTLYGPE